MTRHSNSRRHAWRVAARLLCRSAAGWWKPLRRAHRNPVERRWRGGVCG